MEDGKWLSLEGELSNIIGKGWVAPTSAPDDQRLRILTHVHCNSSKVISRWPLRFHWDLMKTHVKNRDWCMIMDIHEDDVLVSLRTLLAFLSWPLFCSDLRLFTHIPQTSLELLSSKGISMDVYETRSVKPGDLTTTDIVIVWVLDLVSQHFLP